MNNYIIAIDKIERPYEESCNGPTTPEGVVKLLRFDISYSLAIPDSNNNLKENQSQNLSCFEVLQEGIKSIRISPMIDDAFKVEYTKGPGPSPEKSISVQVIHRRMGKFSDSNENIALIQLPPRNLVVIEPAKMSTFDVSKKSESSRQEGITLDRKSTKENLLISEFDLQLFSRFTFKFSALPTLEIRVENDSNTAVQSEELDVMRNQDTIVRDSSNPIVNEANQPETISDTIESNQIMLDGPVPDSSTLKSNPGVIFTTSIHDKISISIELQNLIYLKDPLRSTTGIANIPYNNANLLNNKIWPSYYAASTSDSKPKKLKDLKDVAKAQVKYEREFSKISSKTKPCPSSRPCKTSTTISFIKAMVMQRFQSLGVQVLECHEIMDAWENRQLKMNGYFLQESELGYIDLKDFNDSSLSPYVSKPNSSLFRLSPSGHISGSIFSTFVHQVDLLRGIVSSATCTLIQLSVSLLLPEIKLLCGRQLETNNNPTFISEWLRLLMLAAKELKPVAPEEISSMVKRELKTLKALSYDLHTIMKKIHHKIEKIASFSHENFRKVLLQFHPKSLRNLDAFSLNLKKKQSPDVIYYDPAKLHKIPIDTADLFKDHVFFSETKTGELLVKNDIDGFWVKFQDLEFSDRRTIFLALTEDLGNNLRNSLNAMKHLQEIYTAGYPGSIKNVLEDVVQELTFTSKRDDLTVLMKTSLVTNISYLYELLARLLFVSEEVDGITKNFSKLLKKTYFNPSELKTKIKKAKRQNLCKSNSTNSKIESTISGLQGYHKEFEAAIQHSNAQLAIPLGHVEVLAIFKNLNV